MTLKRIAFGADMASAILEGKKTVTRRPIRLPTGKGRVGDGFKDITPCWKRDGGRFLHGVRTETFLGDVRYLEAPHQPGDRLLMAEPLVPTCGYFVGYEADDGEQFALRDREEVLWNWKVKRLSSRYCPAWACRRVIEIVDVWADVLIPSTGRPRFIAEDEAHREGFDSPEAFEAKWQSMYRGGPYDLENEPWVWRFLFRVSERSEEDR